MRIRVAVLIAAMAPVLAFTSTLPAQTAPGSADAKAHSKGLMSGGVPDLSGIWDPDFQGPGGIRLNTWDSSDPFAKHPEQAPMTPWAAQNF
jgi:hypothetical protein